MRIFKRVCTPFIACLLAMLLLFSVTACSPVSGGKYRITYHESINELYLVQTYDAGENSVEPPAPSKANNTFAGWYEDSTGAGSAFVFGQKVTADIDLYAKWTPDSTDPGTGGGTGGQTPGGNQPGTGGETDPETGGGSGGQTPEVQKVTVHFNTHGGASMSDVQIDKGTSFNPGEATGKLGYTFEGWYTDSACTQRFIPNVTVINEETTLHAKWIETEHSGGTQTTYFTVTFKVDGETYGEVQSVAQYSKATKPITPQKDGHAFVAWYEESSFDNVYDFTKPVTANITLFAKFEEIAANLISVGAYNESIYATWKEGAPASAKVEFKLASEADTAYREVEKPLIRLTDDTSVSRVDVVGLSKGSYIFRITPSSGDAIVTPAVEVQEYDRSGYAHFQYTDGVGAYKDNGELKDGALVIYVTEANKNSVLDNAAQSANIFVYHANSHSYTPVDTSDATFRNYFTTTTTSAGVTPGVQTGIGEILNNRRYSGNDRMGVGIAKLCSVYGAVAVRFIGKITSTLNSDGKTTSIRGLTDYDSTDNGGSKGDNGQMARMVNAHDLTLEGIGEDSMIEGFGFHFISSVLGRTNDSNSNKMGKSFEARNLTFQNYPEDALGMEGEQGILNNSGSISDSSRAESDLCSPVERCWVHHCSFLPGHASPTTDSDKSEGDGSCDFKRGQYYTMSYCYYENCHKTNLIGSGDTSLQYNITFHHSYWKQCESRMPLLRRANIHFYNNFISGDQNDSKHKLSYVTSARANCFMFSEANYYDGCKTTVEIDSGGVVKSYNNEIYADFKGSAATKVTSRTATVANSCKFIYRNIDYSHFDTDSTLFYYDSVNHVSDCLLDDAVTARRKCIMYAGANGRGTDDTSMMQYTPTTPVTLDNNNDVAITLPTSTSESYSNNGVLFRNLTGASSETIKFKGQGIFFTLNATATLTVTTTSTGDDAPELVRSDAKIMSHAFTGTLKIELAAGSYFIASGQKDKQCVISAISFNGKQISKEEKFNTLKDAVDELPDAADVPEATAALGEKLDAVAAAAGALTATEIEEFKTANPGYSEKYQEVLAKYSELRVNAVKELIDDIGTVDENAGDRISAARKAYAELTATEQAQVDNYKTLTDAEAAFEQYRVTSLIKRIEAFQTEVNGLTSDTATAEKVKELADKGDDLTGEYDAMGVGEMDDGTDKTNLEEAKEKLDAALEKLAGYENLHEFLDVLQHFKDYDHDADGNNNLLQCPEYGKLVAAYGKLTPEQVSGLTQSDKQLYDDTVAAHDALMADVVEFHFNNGVPTIVDPDGSKTNVFEGTVTHVKSTKVDVFGLNVSGFKLDSNGTLKITLTQKTRITFYVLTTKTFKFTGGTTAPKISAFRENAEGVLYAVDVEFEAGTYDMVKDGGENDIYYAVVQAL